MGLVLKREVKDGNYNIETIDIKTIRREYGKSKRTYTSIKEYGHDISYENERKHNNVDSPSHYKHGKKKL